MQRSILATSLLALFLSTGCSVTGKWSLSAIEPEAARRDFEFASLTLQEDGTFYAESQSTVVQLTRVEDADGSTIETRAKEPGIRTTSGTYTVNEDTLTLHPHSGPPMPYDLTIVDGNHLRLEKFWEGRKVRTTFTRVE